MIFKNAKCECGRKWRDATGKGLCQCGKTATVSEKWYVKFINSNGRPQEKSVSSRKKDAELFLQDVSVKKATGICTDMEPLVYLKDACESWMKHNVNLRPNSLKLYGHCVKYWLEQLGNIPLTAIDLETVSYDIKTSTAAPSTVNANLRVLKMIYRYTLAVYEAKREMPKLARVQRSVSAIKMLKEQPRMSVLTQDDISRLLDNLKGDYHLAVYIGLLTGLRLSNVCDLTWKQVDMVNDCITIQAEDIKDKEALVIPLHPKLKAKLRERKLAAPWDARIVNIKSYQLHFQFKKACAKCGITATFHALRKTFATRLREMGVDISDIANLLGHSDINFTRKIYVKTDLEHQQKVVEAYGNLVGGGAK